MDDKKKRGIRAGIAPIPTDNNGITLTSDGSKNAVTNGGTQAMGEKLCLEKIVNEAGPTFNLRRNGFVIAPEENFSDDGTYFRGYYYDPEKNGDKRFRASKAVVDGDVYLSIRYEDPVTGKTTYFDDLNGVSYQTAIDKIGELTSKIDDFKGKLDRGEITAKKLTSTQIEEIKEKALQVSDATGDSYYSILDKILSKFGIDKYDLEAKVRDQLYKDVESSIRNRKTENGAVVKQLAKLFLKEVMKDMRDEGHYDSKGRYQSPSPKTLDQAIDRADPHFYISKYDSEKPGMKELLDAGVELEKFYWFKELTDATQEKIRSWAKNKLENLYDFE